MTININHEEIAEVNTLINEWLKQNASDLRDIIIDVSYKRIKSLILNLYIQFTLFFKDKFITFIKLFLQLLVQHNLYNKRCTVRLIKFKKKSYIFKNSTFKLNKHFRESENEYLNYNNNIYCELMSLLSIRDWWVRYVTMWDTTLQQLFNEVSMLKSCIDED